MKLAQLDVKKKITENQVEKVLIIIFIFFKSLMNSIKQLKMGVHCNMHITDELVRKRVHIP